MSETGAAPAALPPFYKRPAAIALERHGGMGLANEAPLGFAAASHAILLNDVEFQSAARCYPIVFTATEPCVPIAVTGLRPNENLFVGKDGKWSEGDYVPSYVRRYPFILAETGDKLTLCIDEDSGLLTVGGARPFYVDQKPGEVLQQALNFCSAFHAEHQRTIEFCTALKEQGLLHEDRVQIAFAPGQSATLEGFRMIHPQRFEMLSDQTYLEWRKKGWIGLCHAHFVSLGNLIGLGLRTRAVTAG